MLLRANKDARLAEDSEGTGPTTNYEVPTSGGAVANIAPAHEPLQQDPTWSTNYSPLGAEQGRPKLLASWRRQQ